MLAAPWTEEQSELFVVPVVLVYVAEEPRLYFAYYAAGSIMTEFCFPPCLGSNIIS